MTKSVLLNDVSSFNPMVKYIPLDVFIYSWTFPLFICFIGKRIYHRCVYLYFSSSFETEVFDSSRFCNMAIFFWKKRHKHYNCFVYLQLIDLVMLKNKKRRLKKLLFNLCNSGNFSLLFLFNMKLILKFKTAYLVVKMVSEYTYPHLLWLFRFW